MWSWPDGGYQDHVLDTACENVSGRLDVLDELWDDFLLRNGLCDAEDLR